MELLCVSLILIGVLPILLLIKNENAYKNYIIIIEAIGEYQIDCVRNKIIPFMDFDDMKSYYTTIFRLTDWGYRNILPKDKFEIIKPYIVCRKRK